MHDKLYVWLGSRRAVKRHAGNKAALLDRAAHARLPVPHGIVILDVAYEYALEEGWIAVEADRVVPRHVEGLFLLVLETGFDRPVAVRSAFSAEDQSDRSLAGFFETRLRVDATDPDAFANALCAVWSSALGHGDDVRRDVLVMEMVEAKHAGVAFAEEAYQDDLVNFTAGTAENLVGGSDPGQSVVIPRLEAWERPDDMELPFAHRLQLLLRGVRRTLGDGDWDVEWADDGEVCWLLQARPVTGSPRRNEAFTFANIREIMPDPPSPFMTGIVEAAAPGLFSYYRRFDPTLPAHRPIIEVFAGRPLFNISLLTDMMRHWGLPTRLVTNSIGGAADVERRLRLSRFLRKAPVLLRQGVDQLTAVRRSRHTAQRFLAMTESPAPDFSTAIDRLTELFTMLVTQMFGLTAAMSAPLLLLRQAGTLAEHNARHRAISTAIYTDLAPLRALVERRPVLREPLADGRVPEDPEFRALWEAYLAKHGHRGIYESDIARPRYHEAPAPLLESVIHRPLNDAAPPPLSTRSRLTEPLWRYLRRVLNAREQFRYDAMIAYDRLRASFLTLADAAAAAGQLPGPEALWLLHPDDARRLDNGWSVTAVEVERRRRRLAEHATYDLPDMIHRFDDLEQYREGNEEPSSAGRRLSGVSLTTGSASGRAWVLKEPETRLPAGFSSADTILVARSVDAGWIPTFSRVAGVVVETGGDLSHGSIILREIGLPAITNVAGATRHIRHGEALTLKAASGLVVRDG